MASGKESAAFSHFDAAGKARMVDIAEKDATYREATASGIVLLSRTAFDLVKQGTASKGDVLGTARLAGIMAAKKVDQLIPLAHPLTISKAAVDFDLDEEQSAIVIRATVSIFGKTGVEMEALTAVSVAALTVYDMCKSVDKGMTIGEIRLEKKTGGKSGTYKR